MNIYIYNRTAINPEINNSRIISYKDWRKEKPSINYFCVWRCKCYVYNDLKLLSAGIHQNKFINHKKVEIFLEYSDRTDHQYYIYILDIGSIIWAITVIFNEEV